MDYINRPVIIFSITFAIILIPDLLFGDKNYSPTWQLSNIWFAEVGALIITAAIAVKLYGSVDGLLPWLLAGISALSLCVYVYYLNPIFTEQPPSRYDSFVGRIYYVEHGVLPYTSRIRSSETDYLLTPDLPDFFKLQLFVLAPWLVGYFLAARTSSSRRILDTRKE